MNLYSIIIIIFLMHCMVFNTISYVSLLPTWSEYARLLLVATVGLVGIIYFINFN